MYIYTRHDKKKSTYQYELQWSAAVRADLRFV